MLQNGYIGVKYLLSPFMSIEMFSSRKAHSLFPASGDAYTRSQRINENPLGRIAVLHYAQEITGSCNVTQNKWRLSQIEYYDAKILL